MDPGEGAGDDGRCPQVAGRHRRVLAAASLAVILIAHRNPALPAGSEGSGNGGQRSLLSGFRVDTAPGVVGESIDGPGEEIVADLVQVTAEPEPRSGGRDVVGGA